MLANIKDNTKITLSLAVLLLAGSSYIMSISFQSAANAQAIEQLQNRNKEKSDKLEQIATDVAVIKAKIEMINRKLDN